MKIFRVVCLVSIACALIFAQTSVAADSSFTWTGPYAGVHIGYGWGNGDTSFTPLPTAARFVNLAPQSMNPDPEGVLGGLQIGYNYQMGPWVIGLEADFSWTGIGGSRISSPIIQNDGTPFPGSGYLYANQEINWYGTLRPRFGYAVMPTLLLYGTGGLAYGDVGYSANTNFLPPGNVAYPTSFSKTKVGWTAGGGLEYALTRCWTVKAEYLYMDLGSESVIAAPQPDNPPFQVGNSFETTTHIINLGVNYKF